jgi:hypothetical protein
VAELTNRTDLKTYLGLSGTTYDDLLDDLLEEAEDRIRRICNKGEGLFASGPRTEKKPGLGYPIVYLTHRPVTAIASVKLYYSATDSSTLASDVYRINDEGSAVMVYDWTRIAWDSGEPEPPLRSAMWRPYARGLSAYPYTEIVYTGGYGTIPDDLAGIAKWYAAQLYMGRGINATLQSENLGDYSYVRPFMVDGSEVLTKQLVQRLKDFIIQM